MNRRQPYVSEIDQREWLRRNVRALRYAAGLSARVAAERGGMHLRQWQKIEAGVANVTLDTLAKLCRALYVETTDLLREPPGLRVA